jgi:hypothetical protein
MGRARTRAASEVVPETQTVRRLRGRVRRRQSQK